MKLRHLEERLQGVACFEQPKILLEQYVTPAHLGAHMLYTIESQYGDISDKIVADFGSGSGLLSIGASLLDAGLVLGLELDPDALRIAQQNVVELEVDNVDFVQCDVTHQTSFNFDTVIMNPPFGTKHNSGIDMKFLEVALKLSGVVYSLHKTSTRSHVLKVAERLGAKGEVLAEMRYDLPSTYKFHKKKSVDIEVDFFRFQI